MLGFNYLIKKIMPKISFKAPFYGFAPSWYSDTNSRIGNSNQLGDMSNVDLSNPNYITNGPGYASAGTITELIHHIVDYSVISGYTYGISNTKLWKLDGTTASDDHTITDAVGNNNAGNSVFLLNGALYYIYNKTSSCDVGKYDLASTWTDSYGTTSDPTGVAKKAPHPVDTISTTNKVLAVFGNGRYIGIVDPTTVDFNVCDFGDGSEVVDVRAHNSKFYVAVNTPNVGGNKGKATIYIFDSDFVTSQEPEGFIEVGGKIGSLFVDNGTLYVFHKDETQTQYFLSVIKGAGVQPVAEYLGGMPSFSQITKWKNQIIFLAANKIYAVGNQGLTFPLITYQLSQVRNGTQSGALATPFGTAMHSSYNSTGPVYSLDKFSGLLSGGYIESITYDLSDIDINSTLSSMAIKAGKLTTGQTFKVSLLINDRDSGKTVEKTITDTTKIRHVVPLGTVNVENVRIRVDILDTNALLFREVIFNFDTNERR